MGPEEQKLITIAQIQAVQGEKIERIEGACTDIKHALAGNGKIGLITRVDRLEQRSILREKFFWLVATAVIALVINAIFPGVLTLLSS